MGTSSYPNWTTVDEIRFVNGLGEHRNPRKAITISEKIEFLQKYLDSMEIRTFWGPIDKTAVRLRAQRLLESYEALNHPKGS